jgi:hypothetical protein
MSTRLNIVAVTALVAGIPAGTAPGVAEPYPSRHVRIIAAGAGTFHDMVARHLAQRLSDRWKQGVFVENQPAESRTRRPKRSMFPRHPQPQASTGCWPVGRCTAVQSRRPS